MSEQVEVEYNLTVNVEDAVNNIQRIERLTMRALHTINRVLRIAGLPEDSPLSQAIYKVERMIALIRMLHLSIVALESASGPIGLAFAALGITTFTLTAADVTMELDSH